MAYVLTMHAKLEIARRRLDSTHVLQVAENPEQILLVNEGSRIHQSRFTSPEGRMYLLRVIVDSTTEPASIVTVYRTSKIAKYWRKL